MNTNEIYVFEPYIYKGVECNTGTLYSTDGRIKYTCAIYGNEIRFENVYDKYERCIKEMTHVYHNNHRYTYTKCIYYDKDGQITHTKDSDNKKVWYTYYHDGTLKHVKATKNGEFLSERWYDNNGI